MLISRLGELLSVKSATLFKKQCSKDSKDAIYYYIYCTLLLFLGVHIALYYLNKPSVDSSYKIY